MKGCFDETCGRSQFYWRCDVSENPGCAWIIRLRCQWLGKVWPSCNQLAELRSAITYDGRNIRRNVGSYDKPVTNNKYTVNFFTRGTCIFIYLNNQLEISKYGVIPLIHGSIQHDEHTRHWLVLCVYPSTRYTLRMWRPYCMV